MKKVLCLFLSVLFILGVTACNENSTSTTKQETTKSDYYSIIKKQGNNLVFNLKLEDFVANYNKVASNRIELSDFEKIGTGALRFNPIEVDRYAFIDDIAINVGKSNDSISGIMIVTEAGSTESLTILSTCLKALNPELTEDESTDINAELFGLMAKNKNAADTVYHNGMVVYYQLISDNRLVLGAEAVTEEQYRNKVNQTD